MIVDTNNIYAYSNLFIPFEAGILPIKVYLDFILVLKIAVMVNKNLYYCRCIDNDSHFCKFFYNMIVKKKISKLKFPNYINILPYQKYFDVFNNLTFIKKTFISYAYPIISVIKFRPIKTDSTILYN